VAVGILAAIVASVPSARATPAPVVVASYFQFVPGATPDPVQVVQGTPLYFSHQDPVAQIAFTPWHDLVSFARDEDDEPLFASPLLGFNETAQVAGVEGLAPGSYPFYCASHGADLMRGELVVLDV
jgi:plastocyanin